MTSNANARICSVWDYNSSARVVIADTGPISPSGTVRARRILPVLFEKLAVPSNELAAPAGQLRRWIEIPGPYRFFFYSFDRNERDHIHVQREDCVCKYWADACSTGR
jgi:hypothetical protein